MAAESIPSWVDYENLDIDTGSWFKVIIGNVILPGIAMIDGLGVGLDVETKKAKGSDQWTSKDNGLDKSEFKINLQLTEADWTEFQATLSQWNPRRPGRIRGPVDIIHPLVNAFEIKSIRIIRVEVDSPDAKRGMEVKIFCQEWFDAPKETKANNETSKPARITTTYEEYLTALSQIRAHSSAIEGVFVPKDQTITQYNPNTKRMETVPGARLQTALKERNVDITDPVAMTRAAMWEGREF